MCFIKWDSTPACLFLCREGRQGNPAFMKDTHTHRHAHIHNFLTHPRCLKPTHTLTKWKVHTQTHINAHARMNVHERANTHSWTPLSFFFSAPPHEKQKPLANTPLMDKVLWTSVANGRLISRQTKQKTYYGIENREKKFKKKCIERQLQEISFKI